MSSPVSEETLEELRESAKETAKQFGISYTLNIAWTLYERAREAAENSEPNSLRLQYRKFETVVRTDLLAGYVDVRSGEGPGAMGSWKKVYCVERSDYGIELYANKGAFQKHRKPKATIRPRGYTVVTKHVAKPFRKLIEPVAEGLGIDKGALHGILDFPPESWALFHPQRTKYVFRTCKKSRFARNKKKPPSVTADDEAIDRKEWIYFLKTCVRKAKSRDTDTVLGKAFDRTCEKISEKVEALKDWKDDGTEDEMLLEMLMTSCLPPVLDIVLSQVKGQLSIPLAPFGSFASVIASRVLIPVWFKTVGILKKAIQIVLSKAWTKIQEEAQAVFDKVEPVLRRGLEKVTKVHNTILDTIKNATNKTLGALLSKAVTPLIEPLLKVYTKPLTDGFTFVRETYWTSVTSDDLPKGETERKDFLDAIPRKRKTMRKVYTYAVEMSEGLHTAKKLINSIMRTLGCDSDEDDDEEHEEDDDLCAEAEESLLKSLDATVYTLYLRLENGEKMNDALMENILTEQFDADAILLKRDIVKKGTRQFVLRYFKKAIKANEDISGAIEKADSFIPSEMKDFLSVEGIFDGFIDIVVGEPIVLKNAKETAKQFGISYALNTAYSIYERAREAAEKHEPTSLRLQYREFDTVVRTDLLAGYVDVRSGEGPGAMGSWKKVYCVERNDYGIELYTNKEAFEKHKKPKTKIRPRGYKVVTKNIAKPFRKLVEPIVEGLGIDRVALRGVLEYPDDSWALFHPLRKKYIFRTCKQIRHARKKKQSQSVSLDDEDPIDRDEWIYCLKTCVRKAKSRDTDTVLGKAFDRTCEKMSNKIEALKDWRDDGTEEEMLLELLMTSCLPPVLDMVLEQIKNYLSIPLALSGSFASIIACRVLSPVWFKTLLILKKAVHFVLKKVWPKILEGAQAMFDKVEPVLRKGLAPITTVHNKILDSVKTATNKTLGVLCTKTVTPLIEPLLKAYSKPLTDGFTFVRETYWTSVTPDLLPNEATERKDFLDAIPRNRKTMRTLYTHAVKMSERLDPTKKLIDGILRNLGCRGNEDDEEDEEEEDLCAEVEDSLLTTLDATVYTLHYRLENGEKMNDALLENILTEQFDADTIRLKCDLITKGSRQFVLRYFKRAIKGNQEISGAISLADSFIPNEMKDFLSVEGVFDGFIDILIGEPIGRSVEASKMFR